MADNQDRAYSSRSLDRLDKAIRECKDKAELLILFAKRASNLARLSCLPEARELVAELRAANPDYDPRLSAWIIYAEGMILHFDTLDNAKSKDKFNRAFLVSQMAGDRELAGASAAWMAHCAFIAGRIEEAATHISTAFRWSDAGSGEARGRASMALADSLNWAGQTEQARHWYREARSYAVRDGDIAMQNVMLYNMANFSVYHMTIRDCISEVPAEECRRVAMEVASAANLNTALGIGSLSSLVPVMQAELMVVQRNWQDAVLMLNHNIDTFGQEGQSRLLPKIYAQRAWAKANLGDKIGALTDIRTSTQLDSSSTDLDDQLIMHLRLSGAGSLLGEDDIRETHASIAALRLESFRSQQEDMQNTLRALLLEIKEINPAAAGFG